MTTETDATIDAPQTIASEPDDIQSLSSEVKREAFWRLKQLAFLEV